MSERELRKFAKETAGQYAPPGVRDLCRGLVADDPDVVKVLRWLKVFANEYQANGLGRVARELDIIGEQLGVTFHVRLTSCPDCGGSGYLRDTPSSAGEECGCMGQDVGWEWTDE